ncbi:hypothetical protein [Pseudofrankia sp. BMG5.36]|uniref:hypothetical protein n=1 Tax=Pseudofrankia sp. BMG5.36 TaxID=1834512 RepID=UPI000ADD7B1A|nr:hypothetical protein [Pseudofrankia sp. BMG5.36]
MLALVAALCFLLAAFGVDSDDINLVWLGLAFLAGHFAFPITSPRFNRARR